MDALPSLISCHYYCVAIATLSRYLSSDTEPAVDNILVLLRAYSFNLVLGPIAVDDLFLSPPGGFERVYYRLPPMNHFECPLHRLSSGSIFHYLTACSSTALYSASLVYYLIYNWVLHIPIFVSLVSFSLNRLICVLYTPSIC